MKIKNAILSLTLLMIFSNNSNAQSTEDFKYLMILNYLNSDSAIIEKIKGLYRQIGLISKKEKHVDFKIVDTVEFFYLSTFRHHDTLKSSELGLEQSLIDSSNLYREKFYFEPYESQFLKRVSFRKDSHLYLTFSKPVGNYVIVELNNKRNNPRSIRKTGVAMSILFIFDTNGFIERTSIQSGVYN